MSFLYPFGLLGLIGIPILILIYILKNKYTEQSISSNYIWKLSEKFLKNRHPISKFAGIISLILQCLIVAVISIGIAHPKFSLKDKANDYYFVLDASGSMNNTLNDETRFSKAKKEIKTIINDSYNGSSFSLILVSSDTKIVYEDLENKEKAVELLEETSCTYQDTNCLNSIAYLQQKYQNNEFMKVYVLTDKKYETTNVNLIYLGDEVKNLALSNLTYSIEESKLEVKGNISSYNLESKCNLSFYVDDILTEKLDVDVNLDDNKEFSFIKDYQNEEVNFDSIKVEINNNDDFVEDNSYIIYNLTKEHDYKVLIVSDQATYLKSLINSFNVATVEVVSTTKYNDTYKGYGLYIFDSFSPATIPSDGSIWFFNVNSSIKNSGFTIQNEFNDDEGFKLEKSNMKTEITKKLLTGVGNDDLYVSKYYSYGIYAQYQSLYQISGQPVIFTCLNDYSNREVVFSFDLHNSNLPLMMDYIIMSKNLINYSFPEIIDNSNYVCGDDIDVNVVAACKSIKVISPSNETKYLDVNQQMASYTTTEVGTYTILVNVNDEVKTFNVFVSVPENESKSFDSNEEFRIVNDSTSNKKKDGIYDNLMFIFISISILFIAEWMVYCYEQYQLR